MHQVELGLGPEITADGARGGLLHRIGAASQLPERRDGPRAFENRGDDRAGGDELQQVAEERLVLVLGVVRRGDLVADVLEFERRDGQAFALDRLMISPITRL